MNAQDRREHLISARNRTMRIRRDLQQRVQKTELALGRRTDKVERMIDEVIQLDDEIQAMNETILELEARMEQKETS